MASYTYTHALIIDEQEYGSGPASEHALMVMISGAFERNSLIETHSRHGVIQDTIRQIWKRTSGLADLCELSSYRVIRSWELDAAISSVDAFLSELRANPQIVVEATAFQLTSETTLTVNGMPGEFRAEVVYPPLKWQNEDRGNDIDASDVKELLGALVSSRNPKPDWDDEGESLAYALNTVVSHRFLMEEARERHGVFIYVNWETTPELFT